jgi:hypothetical protein
MPNQDGSLTEADKITLTRALDRMITSTGDTMLEMSGLDLLNSVHERAELDASSRSAFLRIVDALSLDLLSHAVGGFAALTKQEQISSLLNVENTLPEEFTVVLNIARDVYYENESTPERPKNFDDDDTFGKQVVEIDPEPIRKTGRRNR